MTTYLGFLVGLINIQEWLIISLIQEKWSLLLPNSHIDCWMVIFEEGEFNLATGVYSQKVWIQLSFQKLSDFVALHCFIYYILINSLSTSQLQFHSLPFT